MFFSSQVYCTKSFTTSNDQQSTRKTNKSKSTNGFKFEYFTLLEEPVWSDSVKLCFSVRFLTSFEELKTLLFLYALPPQRNKKKNYPIAPSISEYSLEKKNLTLIQTSYVGDIYCLLNANIVYSYTPDRLWLNVGYLHSSTCYLLPVKPQCNFYFPCPENSLCSRFISHVFSPHQTSLGLVT